MPEPEITSFIAFDVETATSKRHSICQLGIAWVKDLQIIKTQSILIQPPENEYEARNSCIHGLTSLDTKQSPFFPTVWKGIEKDFRASVLVAHNATFDLDVISKTLTHYNLKVPDFKYICTYQHTHLDLKSLCESLNVELEKHHDAKYDAIAAAEALIKLLQGEEPNYSLITADDHKGQFDGHDKLSGDVLKPNLDIEDKENPFYSKKVVFTGVLSSISRTEAANILKNKGADIDTGITKRTKYVIMGKGAGPSKIKKIEELQERGCEIEILTEEIFMSMIR